MSDFQKEACVETLMEAIQAYANGADQLELCSQLDQDGLTPEYELVEDVVEAIDIPVKVMIRSRAGNFVYTDKELNLMLAQVEALKALPIGGIVFGALTEDNQLDLQTIKTLCHAAGNLEVTIHKCIDEIENYATAIESLKSIPNVKWILTSGTKNTAEEGKHILKEMMSIASPEIRILPAGKILPTNVDSLHTYLDATVYHGRKIVG